MSELPPALAAALAGDRPLLVGMVEIDLPSYTLRLLDGAAELMIGGVKWTGRDPIYGVLDTIKGLSDQVGDQAPSVEIGLIPATTASLATLMDPSVQGSAVTISLASVDMATGIVTPTYVLFSGELDVPTVTWGANDRRLAYKCGSVADRLFATEEGRRLSDAFHQKVWPGEAGLAFMTEVEQEVDWGQSYDTTVIETRTNLPSMGGSTFNRT